MASWAGSDRRSRLPADWPTIRKRILRRDGHRCTARMDDGRRCKAQATEVDHIRRGDDHRDSNLRSLCSWHHGKKSAQEGAQASWAKKRRIEQKFNREERHPGLL